MATGTVRKGDPNWWRGAVIYQVYPRSFQDTTGDGIGDIRGITARLPHIASLGVDAIWLSPFFTSPMADMGYDVSDYCNVDPMFGALSDFDAMMAECERLGLKVVIDQVISHTSDQHPWFVESRTSRTNPRSDWYVWADPKPDGTAPNNWLSIFGGPAWEWDGVRKQYYMHNFLGSQPDLNFHNPDVQDAVLATVKFWLDRGVHGFRLDTVNYYFHDKQLRNNPPMVYDPSSTGLETDTNPYSMQHHLYDKSQPENIEFLKRLRALLDRYDCRTTVGEVGDADRSLTTLAIYTSGNDKLHMCYTFDLLSPRFTADHIRSVVSKCQEIVTNGWVCWAFSNHDVVRHVSRFMETPEEREPIAKIAISVLSTLRGSICLYQGEELGLPEAELSFEDLRDPYGIRFWPAFKGRDGCRTPMVWEADQPLGGFSSGPKAWLPVPPEHLPLAVSAQEGIETSILAHYRETLAFRRAHGALLDGDMTFLDTQADLLAFVREKGGERLLFVFNLTREAQDYLLPASLADCYPLPMPGYNPPAEDKVVRLSPFDVFCARL